MYGNYHKELALTLLPYLPRDGHICDAGCGLGHLALELAKQCRSVTAVDQSAAALKGLMSKKLPPNLRVLQGDIFSMEERYDAMVFCYFGKTEQILQIGRKQCGGRILVVRRDCSIHCFSNGPVPRKEQDVNRLTQVLEKNGIPFTTRNLSLELGQPLRSLEDAFVFFSLYNKSDRPIIIEELEAKLVRTDSETFPWYYPSTREMELIVFETEDLA